ncbi:hypothetical protein L208DRAFT_1462363 [Tricholoma matsutake]|nr:hypothetical protein L208DRAFT_1462363 [Tricholoma matsutake 945]
MEEDGQAAKRKEIDRDVPDIQTHCVAIHKAIKAMPDNLDLSNPSTFTTLPFPSLLPMPSQHFEKKKINGVHGFQYMGRSKFRELEKRVENEDFLDAHESLYLYRTSGSGKSHLLAALVYHLVREGKRVFYIPDCSSLLLAPAQTIWAALTFAFYDSDVLGTIGDPYNVDTLIRFMSKHRDLYIIVDQVNVLETADAGRSRKEMLNAMSSISVFRIFGGMSEDETDQWFILHVSRIPQLSAEQRERVEYLTGRIPLLLRCLFNMTNFDELKFRNMPDLLNVAFQVESFFRTKVCSLHLLSKQTYLEIMRACVQGDLVRLNDRSLYDLRHFYVDEKGIGRFTCGIAFETMMSMLRTHDDAPFMDDLWYTAVSRSSNPVVWGFLAEQIFLSYIGAHGLRAVHPKLGLMSTVNFSAKPAFDQLLSDGHTTRLYVPIAYNFMAVDGVILLLERASKKATMFSIQFMLSQKHKQFDVEFHMRLWSSWTESITSAGFEVESTFVWIDTTQSWERVKPRLVKALRSRDKVIYPNYTVLHMGVEMVDKKLTSALGIKK